MDRDVFSKVSRLGRDAGDSVVRGLADGYFDPFLCAKVLDKVIHYGGGFPSWPYVKQVLDGFQEEPLYAATRREQAVEMIEDACRSEGGDLDNVLRQASIASVLGGVTDPEAVMGRCMSDVLDRAVFSPRGGCFERLAAQQRPAARLLVEPISQEAARVLVRRPDAKQTTLARRYKPSLGAGSNLLGDDP